MSNDKLTKQEREAQPQRDECTCQKTPQGMIGWDRSMVSSDCPQHGEEALPPEPLPDLEPHGECPLCGGETEHAERCYVGELEHRLAQAAAPSSAEVEAAAAALWKIGNKRIGFREWDSVAEHYLTEGKAALVAARAGT